MTLWLDIHGHPLGLSWGFEQPAAAALFLLPAVVVALSFQRTRPRSLWLGTARFFPDHGEKAGSERRRSIPWSRVAAIAGMAFGTLALMGPAPAPLEPGPERFACVVDRSPSLYLPAENAAGNATGAGTRLAEALARMEEALTERSERSGREVELVWVDGSEPGARVAGLMSLGNRPLGDRPPSDWLERSRVPRPETRFAAFDSVGTIWITDRQPAFPGQRAGYVASGGAAAPGVIATTRSEGGAPAALLWSGEPGAALRIQVDGQVSRVAIDPALPGLVFQLANLWAADRGVQVVDGGARPAEVELIITQVSREPGTDPAAAGSDRGGRVGRDGWTALVSKGSASSESEAGFPWLAAEDGSPVLASRPGAVNCAIIEFLTPPDDAAAFAVSMAGLFDAAILPHPDVVPLEERQGAGPGAVSLPRDSLPLDQLDPRTLERLAGEAAGRARGVLLAVAALAGALALWLRLGNR